MVEENIDILNHGNDIEKAFIAISEAYLLNQIPQDIFEKAQKVYKDNAENRKLKRVGKPWGKNGQDTVQDTGQDKKEEPSKDKEEKSLEQHAKEASEADLERTIKESGDEKLRQAAHVELERRQKEEAPQEEEKKKVEDKDNKEVKNEEQRNKDYQSIKDTIKEYFDKHPILGKLKRISESNTSFGTSHYLKIEDSPFVADKIRVSDHSISNKGRMESEFNFPVYKNNKLSSKEEINKILDLYFGDYLKKKEEKTKEKEPPSGEKPEADIKKESDTAGKDSDSGGVSEEDIVKVKKSIEDSGVDFERIKSAFGGDSDKDIVENIFGFLGGKENIGDIDNLLFGYSKDSVELSLENDVLSMERIYNYVTKEVKHHSLFVRKQGNGIGTRIFNKQIENYIKQGYKKVKTLALKNSISNGFYTWPRLGFDIEDKQSKSLFKEFLKATGRDENMSISALMETSKGREDWNNFGFAFEGVFDLSNNSESLKILKNYTNGKNKK